MYPALHRPEGRVEPVGVGDLFRLNRAGQSAMCALFTHGQGWELRLVVDGDLARSTVCGSQDEGLATAEDWERQLREDEWTCTSDPSTQAL